ncbi:TetR/AcrR family transcriptional regulator [Mangrovicella endophytica]|uniref:TetR/AcrR family transcriptional regulator n=1 Tax=Mangrovicella endophytica TaxID=2066697 RepID=UPI000C9E82DE|nr:TetR/AcrR family transcriptional regulator [Mangrovicella endophytica]
MGSPTADKILDAARSLLVAGGYNGFSYADISTAVGIRKASIHHHYPTKAELVAVLLRRYVQQAQDGLAALSQAVDDPAGQLDAYLAYWQACLLDATQPFCVCAMLASEMPLLPEPVAVEVRSHFRTLSEWLTGVLTAGETRGSFRLNASPEAEAQMIMAAVHGAMLSARAFGDATLFLAIMGPQAARLRA